MTPKLLEILQSITRSVLGSMILADIPQVRQSDASQELSRAIQHELGVDVTLDEIESADSLAVLSAMVEPRLDRDAMGRSLVEIYAIVEQFVKEEVFHETNYHWYARWKGDVLHKTDSLEDVELVLRMEEAFGFSISDRDAAAMQTVAQTVRYLWRRSCEQSFTLRQQREDACPSVFIFNELRRLLMIRGGVPRTAVRLEARLSDLLPSWYLRFWKEVQGTFDVALPHGQFLTLNLGLEKRATIRKLVELIASKRAR